jgi:hypothetical protein
MEEESHEVGKELGQGPPWRPLLEKISVWLGGGFCVIAHSNASSAVGVEESCAFRLSTSAVGEAKARAVRSCL